MVSIQVTSWVSCGAQELERKFDTFGPVKEARVVRNPATGESRGFGFVVMTDDKDVDDVSQPRPCLAHVPCLCSIHACGRRAHGVGLSSKYQELVLSDMQLQPA